MDKLPSGETWWKLESRLIQCELEYQGKLEHQGKPECELEHQGKLECQGKPECELECQGKPECELEYQGKLECQLEYQGKPECELEHQGKLECQLEYQGKPECQGKPEHLSEYLREHLDVVKLQHINAEERAERKFVLHGTECGLGVGGTQKIIIDQRNGEGEQRIDDRIENGKNEKSGTSKQIAINGESNNNERDKKLELLITFILSKIDDLMSLYTETMKKHAEEIFIQEMKIFITDKCISKIFTLGKVRTIMNWLNGNKITKTSLYVIVQFVNWFLDINLVELKYVKNDLYIIQ